MEWPSGWENITAFPQEVEVLQLITVEVSRHVDAFSSDDHHFVAGENKLSYNGGQTAKHVAPAINNNGLW